MYEVKASLVYPSGKVKTLKAYYLPKSVGTTAYFKQQALKQLQESIAKEIGIAVGCKIIGFKKVMYDVLIIGK